ncbi:phosphocholine cytidylyltransferase family protein [Methanobacterium formicicum]|uniref:phosphocholine cytidylyltransferase family protein n=1 Tax=Methanobacterium formicicum TaxID=2162 RepID=UPI0018D30B8D|nr:phosphocholine cytidylyltransferase family protein [Methanobacterium formicicum]
MLKNINYGGDNIKVVILAAGFGSRLGENIPKAIVKINEDMTILDLQLENLKQIIELDDVTVVVGYKKDIIQKKYPFLSYIDNENYSTTNTSKSLLLALEEMNDYDVLWINGDVVFDADILRLIQQNKSKNLICVNKYQVSEEEVKYTVDNEGYIKNLSKSVEGVGEAVGINFIKKEDIKILISCLKECNNNDYFEKGIEFAMKKGIKFWPLDIENNYCVEIDFQEDLKMVRNRIL